jgi:RNA polymerase sigma factor (sigma-70 family)
MPACTSALAHFVAPASVRPSFSVICGAGSFTGPAVTIRQLVRIRLQDEAAREAYLRQWLPVVEREARRYANLGGLADDLTAEGALALWEAALQYDPQRHHTAPERYIHNQIHRRVRQGYQAAMGFRGLKVVPVETVEREARHEEGFAAAERQADLARAVEGLRAGEQAEFQAYLRLALSGMGPDEAARALAVRQGESFAACKKRIERLRRKVRGRL